MFLTDSLFNCRSTEPIWFRFFRGSFAIILTVLLVYYLFDNVSEINRTASLVIKPEFLKCNIIYNLYICLLNKYQNFY